MKKRKTPRGFLSIPSPRDWKRGKQPRGNIPGAFLFPPKTIPAGCGRFIAGGNPQNPEALEAMLLSPNPRRNFAFPHGRIPGKIPQIIPSQAHPGRLWSKILPQILPLFPEFPPNASPSVAPRVDTVTPGIFGILCAGGSSGDGICGPSGHSKCSVLSRGGTNSARNFGISESRLCLILTIQLCFQLGQDLLHGSNNIYRIFVGGEEKILLF